MKLGDKILSMFAKIMFAMVFALAVTTLYQTYKRVPNLEHKVSDLQHGNFRLME